MQDDLRKVTCKTYSAEKQFVVAQSVRCIPFPGVWGAPHGYRCAFSQCLQQMIDHEVKVHTRNVFQDELEKPQVGTKARL